MGADEFWAKVDRSGGPDACWPWLGVRSKKGYGQWRPEGHRTVPVYAHRLSYQLAHGGIPKGAYVLHTCDNPPCVNPAHLGVGSQTDNMREMYDRARDVHNAPRGASHYRARLTDEAVAAIRERYRIGELSQEQIAREFGVSQITVSRVIRRVAWRHVP